MINNRLAEFWHGADYNPDQWLDRPDVLKADIEYMKKAKCNVMSIGIFSWSTLEPEEGVYNFEWLDGIIDSLYENGIYTILFMSPIFPYITEWKEIIEISKEYVDEYWFENLNLRGSYKKEILDYIKENYNELYSKYLDIYVTKNNNYWTKLADEINNYCEKNKIKYVNYFYHKELVEKKKEGIKNG